MNNRSEYIRSRLDQLNSLPAIGQVVLQILRLVETEANLDKIATIIATDPSLTARILKLVNSPLYGFPRRVSNISHAVILLGLNVLKGVAVSAQVLEALERQDRELWMHSLGTAATARIIAEELALEDVEEISTAALMHDIGRLVIKHDFQSDYEAVRRESLERGISMFRAEEELLGASHAIIGGWLAEAWLLPERLVRPISYHHSVLQINTASAPSVFVVHLADVLIKLSDFGSSGDEHVSQVERDSWDRLGLDRTRIEKILQRQIRTIAEIKDFYQID